METEGVALDFTEDAIEKIADIAVFMNEQQENIGARRLHTVIETLMEEISYYAPDYDQEAFVIDRAYVERIFASEEKERDFKKYIL
jgi:ATP-dependent HslUV protease ATP-binding subunit HslU